MHAFLEYTVIGIVLGSAYAVAASGLVVTYSTSGIFNIAHGAIGMFMAFVYWQLSVGWHLNQALSLRPDRLRAGAAPGRGDRTRR